MISYLEGRITTCTPAYAIIDCGGIGYHVNISLYTFEKIKSQKTFRVLTVLSVKEDSHTLFGFADEHERMLFRNLISVNGIGPNTGRMILSSLAPNEIHDAIISGNLALLKSIKGIGPKSAQRLILELQDKLRKETGSGEQGSTLKSAGNPVLNEASAALVMLGFPRNNAEKALNRILQENGKEMGIEELIKAALKVL
jgi:Holliday junction DNA helicase RuvA